MKLTSLKTDGKKTQKLEIFCFIYSEHKFDLFTDGHRLPLSLELTKVIFAGAWCLSGIVKAQKN